MNFGKWACGLALAAGLLFTGTGVQAQEHRHGDKCGSHILTNQILENDPAARRATAELEEFTQQFTESAQRSGRNARTGFTRTIIPVVVHVLWHSSAPGSRIAEANAFDAIRRLNDDFGLRNADTNRITNTYFRSVLGNPNIEFRLARRDPAGNCTNGIVYWEDANTIDANNSRINKEGKAWNTSRYLNIYVVQTINTGSSTLGTVLGYAHFPGTVSPSSLEGIVIRNDHFGALSPSSASNYLGRTLTHEVGHYLNLSHTWGNSTFGGNTCGTNTDFVADTPNCIGTFSCNLATNSCADSPVDHPDNVQNYMDYADNCGVMFTDGQAIRMRAALASSIGGRSTLGSATNLQVTGVADGQNLPDCIPTPEILSNPTSVCTGSATTLLGDARNVVDRTGLQYRWVLPGTTTGLATGANPSVTYNTPGTHLVRLVVSNSAGRDSVQINGFVSVGSISPGSSFSTAGYLDGFESSSRLDNRPNPLDNWSTFTINPINWRVDSVISPRNNGLVVEGRRALRFSNGVSANGGDLVRLRTPALDLTNINNPVLKFKLAHRRRSSVPNSNTDQLRLRTSQNCFASYRNGNLTLTQTTTNPVYTVSAAVQGAFIPNGSQWREVVYSLQPHKAAGIVQVEFEWTPGGGGDVWIDSVFLDGTNNLADYVANTYQFKAYPNPFADDAVVQFETTESEPITLNVMDMTGRVYSVLDHVRLSEGTHQFHLAEHIPNMAAGLYVATLKTSLGTSQLKLIRSR